MYQFCDGPSVNLAELGVEKLGIISQSKALSNQALRAFNKGNYDEPVELFLEALKINPNNHIAHVLFLRAQLMSVKGWSDALEIIAAGNDYRAIFLALVNFANQQDLSVAEKVKYVVNMSDLYYLDDIKLFNYLAYKYFDELENKKQFDLEALKRTRVILVKKFNELGDFILECFPKEPAMIKLATTAWKKTIEERYWRSVYKHYDLKGKVMWWDVLADKIKKFEPNYALPTFMQQEIGDTSYAPSATEDDIDL